MKFELTEEQIDTVITALHMQQTGVASNITQELTRQRQDQPTEGATLTFVVLDHEGVTHEFSGATGIEISGQMLYVEGPDGVVAVFAPSRWSHVKQIEPLGQTGGEGDDVAGGTSDGGGA